jgi:hypothetical protein
MGLLPNSIPSLADEDGYAIAEYRDNSHEVIGDALELFSKYLRAHR